MLGRFIAGALNDQNCDAWVTSEIRLATVANSICLESLYDLTLQDILHKRTTMCLNAIAVNYVWISKWNGPVRRVDLVWRGQNHVSRRAADTHRLLTVDCDFVHFSRPETFPFPSRVDVNGQSWS